MGCEERADVRPGMEGNAGGVLGSLERMVGGEKTLPGGSSCDRGGRGVFVGVRLEG